MEPRRPGWELPREWGTRLGERDHTGRVCPAAGSTFAYLVPRHADRVRGVSAHSVGKAGLRSRSARPMEPDPIDNAFVVANVLAVTNASAAAVEAFGDPVRRQLVERLAARPQSVTDLAAGLPVSRSAVSQHLSVLAGAGLVGYEVRGRQHLYHVEPDGLAGLRAYLDRLWDAALTSYAALEDTTADKETDR